MKKFSGLDFLEMAITGIFFGVIALTAFGVRIIADFLLPVEAGILLRLGAVIIGLALGFYIAGWVIFKDLGPTFIRRALAPYLAPKFRVIVPRDYVGYVTVLFGDAYGTMKKENAVRFYQVFVGSDGIAMVPCPSRLAFFWTERLKVSASMEGQSNSAPPRDLYPWDWGFQKGGASFNGLNAYYISFYWDTSEHLEEIRTGKRQANPLPHDLHNQLIKAYFAQISGKNR